VRGVQLRGLAPDQVLVLINGKRRHASAVLDTESSFAGTVPVDVNAIPPGAIDHIEILRDGAGAQYGSDAVAGVINIVLKKPAGRLRLGQLRRQPHRLQAHDETKTDGQTKIVNADYGVPLGDAGSCASAPTRAAATRPSAPASATPAGPRGIPRRPTWRSTARSSSSRATRTHNNYLFYNAMLPLEMASMPTPSPRSTSASPRQRLLPLSGRPQQRAGPVSERLPPRSRTATERRQRVAGVRLARRAGTGTSAHATAATSSTTT
jgi:iron complex outermembrane receptor protein